mmetsp:Transcript_15838/g.30997  ORF Transcript_15838/g.30997 Transcript_15838/m.30997 type:complete len:381 (-) Transcript_15838:52-1194(-)
MCHTLRRFPTLIKLPSSCLTVATYNLLAPCFVRVENQPWNAYPFCNNEQLQWNNRQALIVKQLTLLDADVVCLQEVQLEEKAANEWVVPAWLKNGLPNYTVVLQAFTAKQNKRTADRNQRVMGRRAVTCAAVMYRQTKFKAAAPHKSTSRSLTVYLQLITTTITTTGSNTPEIAISCCHLEGNPNKQAEQLKQLQSAVQNLCARNSLYRLVCGDFNTEAKAGSIMHQYLHSLSLQPPPSSSPSPPPDAPPAAPAPSPATAVLGSPLTELATGLSWATPEDAMRLDHILYSSSSLQATGVLDIAHSCKITHTGLPNSECPSDHLLIAGCFEFSTTLPFNSSVARFSDYDAYGEDVKSTANSTCTGEQQQTNHDTDLLPVAI